jgi:hypothetical protein
MSFRCSIVCDGQSRTCKLPVYPCSCQAHSPLSVVQWSTRIHFGWLIVEWTACLLILLLQFSCACRVWRGKPVWLSCPVYLWHVCSRSKRIQSKSTKPVPTTTVCIDSTIVKPVVLFIFGHNAPTLAHSTTTVGVFDSECPETPTRCLWSMQTDHHATYLAELIHIRTVEHRRNVRWGVHRQEHGWIINTLVWSWWCARLTVCGWYMCGNGALRWIIYYEMGGCVLCCRQCICK